MDPTPTDRQLLAVLAARAIGAEPHQREAVIAEATEGRPDLRAALMKLIEESSAEPADDPLEDLADVFGLAAAEETEDPFDQSGTKLDRYRLVRRIGAGAYGAVYLAEQGSPVKRMVAIKLLHHGVGSPRIIRRFALERRVLASLDHPGVARLIDAGAAPDGRPYLVMDLIDGPSLLDYCREHGPSIADRVRLLARVCDAVQHAHGRGVVHRDIKPGNILIKTTDRGPEPVVIDFGVARLIDPEPDTAMTTLGHQVGTRRFMSPEQRTGSVVDARADIYSLGVTIADAMAAHGDPADGPEEPPPGSVAKALPKGLRWIVDRCIADRPDDRYQTAAELGADLRRFIAGEPVTAAPPSALYRAGRLVARRPVPTALSLAALAAVVGFAVYAQASSVRLSREVEAQRRLITATIDDVIDDIWVFMGSEDAREKLLDRLHERTEELLRRHPNDIELLEIKARLLRALGYFYEDRSDADAMLRATRESLAIYESLAPLRPQDPEFLRAHAEAKVRVANALTRSGRRYTDHDILSNYELEANAMLREAHARYPHHIGIRDDLYWSINRTGYLLPHGEARRRINEQCLAIAHSLVADSPDRILSWYALADAYSRNGESHRQRNPPDLDRARDHFEQALPIYREIVSTQPARGAFVEAYGNTLSKLLAVHRAKANREGIQAVIQETESWRRGLNLQQLNRSTMQANASLVLRELAMAHAFMDQSQEAASVAAQLADWSNNPSIQWSPYGRGYIESSIRTLENAGILPRDEPDSMSDRDDP